MMKKTLLALTVLSAISVSGVAKATLVEGPFNGSLDFTGTITNTSPEWAWGIPVTTKTAVTGVALEAINGKDTGSNLDYDILAANGLTFLEGAMTKAGQPNPSLLPVITVDGVGINLSETSQATAISIDVNNGTDSAVIGALNLNANVQMVTSAIDSSNSSQLLFNGTSAPLAKALLEAQPWFAATYPSITDASGYPTRALTDTTGRYLKVGSAITLTMDQVKLSIPKGTSVTTWKATLPVVVTVA